MASPDTAKRRSDHSIKWKFPQLQCCTWGGCVEQFGGSHRRGSGVIRLAQVGGMSTSGAFAQAIPQEGLPSLPPHR
jgi:hypothetical protein